MINMPGKSHQGALPPLSEEEKEVSRRLKGHVEVLANDYAPHNVFHVENLRKSEDYLVGVLAKHGYDVRRQAYDAETFTEAGTVKVHNFDTELRGTSRPEEVIVVGAHYDTVHECPGANDNTSGVAGVLELARLFAGKPQARTIRWVLFVNEEPPFFQTEQMGSLVYAKGCAERNENIVGMFTLETIGYYSDEPGSQHYPFPFSAFYPSTGNFIAFVGNRKSSHWVRDSIKSFRQHVAFPSEGIAAPEAVGAIGLSDHWSFWQAGFPAYMITDTAPFRYQHYHTMEDTPDKLDYDRTARVVAGLVPMLKDLANP